MAEDWLAEAEERYRNAAAALARLNAERPPESPLWYDSEGNPIEAPFAVAAAMIALAHELQRQREDAVG